MKRILGLVLMVGVGLVSPALAQPKYDPGASDVEIKIGNIRSLQWTGLNILGLRQGLRGIFQSDQ